MYRALAVHAAARGDWIGAEPDFRKAIDAVQQLHDGLPLDADRTHFLECQQTRLVDPARACLIQLGKAEEAEIVAASFRPQSPVMGSNEFDPTSHSTAEVTAEVDSRVTRNRRYLVMGLLLGVFDLVVGIIIMTMNLARDLPNNQAPRHDLGYDAEIVYGALLLLGALVILPMGGIWYMAGLLFPSLHKRLGWIIPGLALAPWVLATLILGLLLAARST